MITRSFDPTVMEKAFAPYERYHSPLMDFSAWVENLNNRMYVNEQGDVGLATFEYSGVYNVHWFFQSRGKEAIKVAKAMIDRLFKDTDAKIVRGLTPVDVKAARFLAKHVGFTSYGLVECPEDDGPNEGVCELMLMTKEEFYGS
jgi:hypothetical protein